MDKTHWKKLENPNYLGSYALEPGKDLVVQIKSVAQEEVYNPTNQKKETCTVAHFVEPVKPMILNVTNCKTISKLYSTPYIEDWAGKYISIYIAKVNAFGEKVDALRIRTKAPTIETFTCSDCKKRIADTVQKTAKELAEISKRNCGRVLCISCMQIEKKKMEESKNE